ncbi:MAG: periplasmic polysaccharide biosynthesis/export protein [Desulfuromonas sp.]|nr:MAG: periplasmic polysaccharide biosynthesis/export protein [Desulfuromonas sp.]
MLVFLPAISAVASENYQIGPGDLLQVTVFDHDELTSKIRVDEQGRIQLPLIGQVHVDGLDTSHISEKLVTLFADGYLVNPQVSIRVDEYRSRKVIVVGQVGRPGLFELSGPTTLLELISKIGGLTKDAGDNITINRKKVGGDHPSDEEILEINIRQLLEEGDTSIDVQLKDGDSVFVPKASIAYVTGEVKRPDSYKIDEGETVIMLITKAGGFTPIASQSRVRIIRTIDGEENVMERVPLNLPVLPDDVIVVPESFF